MLQLFPVVRIVSLLGTKSLRNAPCDYAGEICGVVEKGARSYVPLRGGCNTLEMEGRRMLRP